MADSRSYRAALMDVRVVALYPTRISALSGKPDVRFRRRKKGQESTAVPCRIKTLDGRSVAEPMYAVPDGTPAPRYKAQVETARVAVEERRVVYVVLSAEPEASKIDPEHTLLSPIFDDGHRMIFEFQRAHILTVNHRGDVELRLIAVHPVLGVIGTKTLHRFNTRLTPLATRCVEHLAGAIDLFPARERPTRMWRIQIPEGEANLMFDSRSKAVRRHAPKPREEACAEPAVSQVPEQRPDEDECKDDLNRDAATEIRQPVAT